MIHIQYLGQCGFRIELGDVCLVTDPYLSYYIDETSEPGELVWKRAYPPTTTLREIDPDVILISHEHVDHLDPWTLGEYAGSGDTGKVTMIVPAPEIHKVKALQFTNAIGAQAWKTIEYQGIRITPIPCAHTELHRDERGDFYELSYMICYEGMKLFFAGDMSLYDGIEDYLRKEKPQIMMLPANGTYEHLMKLNVLGNLSCTQAAKLAADCGAKVYIPMHHDLYPVNGCPNEDIIAAAEKFGAPLDLIAPGDFRDYDF